MSSEHAKPTGVKLAEQVLKTTTDAVAGKGRLAREIVRNGVVYPIAYVSGRLAEDEQKFGDTEGPLQQLNQKAQQHIDELK